jgi:hypothetical protein
MNSSSSYEHEYRKCELYGRTDSEKPYGLLRVFYDEHHVDEQFQRKMIPIEVPLEKWIQYFKKNHNIFDLKVVITKYKNVTHTTTENIEYVIHGVVDNG